MNRFLIAFSFVIVLYILFLTSCQELEDSTEQNTTSSGCQAAACHPGSPLTEYPPTSGQHYIHVTQKKYDCDVCHNNYESNTLHKNSEFNGYDAKTKAQKDGEIVFFNKTPYPNTSWTDSSGLCNNIDCHPHAAVSNATPDSKNIDWYSGCGMSCHYKGESSGGCTAGCHYKTPDSSLHTVHLASTRQTMSCPTCHSNYTAKITHANGTIDGYDSKNGIQKDGDIVFFSSTDNPDTTWTNSTNTCGTINCHKLNTSHTSPDNGTQNWYAGCNTGTCHTWKN